jgi:hypothetical protein
LRLVTPITNMWVLSQLLEVTRVSLVREKTALETAAKLERLEHEIMVAQEKQENLTESQTTDASTKTESLKMKRNSSWWPR